MQLKTTRNQSLLSREREAGTVEWIVEGVAVLMVVREEAFVF